MFKNPLWIETLKTNKSSRKMANIEQVICVISFDISSQAHENIRQLTPHRMLSHMRGTHFLDHTWHRHSENLSATRIVEGSSPSQSSANPSNFSQYIAMQLTFFTTLRDLKDVILLDDEARGFSIKSEIGTGSFDWNCKTRLQSFSKTTYSIFNQFIISLLARLAQR